MREWSRWVAPLSLALLPFLTAPCAWPREGELGIAEALDRLRETKALWAEGVSTSRLPGEQWKAREAVALSLLDSENGAEALLEFCVQNPDHVDLFIPASRAARFPKLRGTDAFADFIRAFALFAEKDCLPPETIVYRLDDEALAALAPIWRAWVRGETSIPTAGEPTGHVDRLMEWYYLSAALAALRQIHDIEALPDVLVHGREYLPAPGPDYLYELGAEEAFPLLEEKTRSEPACRFRAEAMSLAPPRLVGALVRDPVAVQNGGGLCSLWHGTRPDLQRALLRWKYDSPGAVAELSQPSRVRLESHIGRAEGRLLASVFSPKELLGFARRAEGTGQTQLPSWVEALGYYPGPEGNRELVRWATSSNDEELGRRTRVTAKRALLRRLVGARRGDVIRCLKRLGMSQFGALVTSGMGELPVLSSFAEYAPPTVVPPATDSRYAPRVFVRRHEAALLDWLPMVEPQWPMATIYALMEGDRGRALLARLIAEGDLRAVEQAWRYSAPVPLEALRSFRVPALPSSEAEIYCVLLRARAGDDESYHLLLDWFPLNNKEMSRWNGLGLAIVKEMERRRDLAQISRCLESSLVPGADPGTGVYFPRTIGAACMAAMLRADEQGLPDTLAALGLTGDGRLQVYLEGAAVAATPTGETILRMVLAANPWLLGAGADHAATTQLLWRAMEATATPWCRDVLLANGQSRVLARLLDSRALTCSICPQWSRLPGDCIPRKEMENVAVGLGEFEMAAQLLREEPGFIPNRPTPFVVSAPLGYWQSDRQERPPEPFLEAFRSRFDDLSPGTKMLVLPLILDSQFGRYPEVVSIGLADSHGPVRLSFLVRFLARPCAGFEDRLREMASRDPYPWCRKLAAAYFDQIPDPLDPEAGEDWRL